MSDNPRYQSQRDLILKLAEHVDTGILATVFAIDRVLTSYGELDPLDYTCVANSVRTIRAVVAEILARWERDCGNANMFTITREEGSMIIQAAETLKGSDRILLIYLSQRARRQRLANEAIRDALGGAPTDGQANQ